MSTEIKCRRKSAVITAIKVQDILDAIDNNHVLDETNMPLWVVDAYNKKIIRAEGLSAMWVSTDYGKTRPTADCYLVYNGVYPLPVKEKFFERDYEIVDS